MSDTASMTDEVGGMPGRRVLVAGGTGRTGRHVVRMALDRGLVPVALARDEARAPRPVR